MKYRYLLAWTVVLGGPLFLPAIAAEPSAPDVLEKLRTGDEASRLEAIDILSYERRRSEGAVPSLIGQLSDPSAKIRAHAVHAIGRIGPAARQAVPALTGLVTADPQRDVRREAVVALRRLRPEPETLVPVLTKALEDPETPVRVQALHTLAELGEVAVPALRESLATSTAAHWACLAIAEIGPPAKAAVPELIALVTKDRRYEVRREAMLALGAIGADAAAAVPVLQHALEEKDGVVRLSAMYALAGIGPAAAAAEPLLRKYALAGSPPFRVLGTWAVARIKPGDQQWRRDKLPMLAETLWDKDVRVRQMAVRALTDLGPAAESVLPILKRAIQGSNTDVVQSALDVLPALGEPAVPLLVETLKQRPEIRPRVARMLARIGPAAKAAVPALVEIATDGDAAARSEALLALAAIGPDADAAVPAAIAALKGQDAKLRFSAVYALGRIGATAIDAAPVLHELAEGRDPLLSLAATWALSRIDPQCPQTLSKSVPQLVRALQDPEPLVRLHATDSLRCLGPRAKAAVPSLKQSLQDENQFVRDMAAEALKSIGE